jgi:hypothetical protein
MKNKDLRKTFANKHCIVCNRRPSEAAHIKTYATTLCDHELNLMPLCRRCHTLQHQIGIFSFISKFNKVALYLSALGWEISETNGKKYLFHEGIENETRNKS